MMPAIALPGFYFDETKQKYFAIQPDHRLPPNAKHAFSNVTKEKRAKSRAAQTQVRHQRKRRCERRPQVVGRARALLPDNVTGLVLCRELGGNKTRYPSTHASQLLTFGSTMSTTSYTSERYRARSIQTAIPQPGLNELVVVYEQCVNIVPWSNVPSQDGLRSVSLDKHHQWPWPSIGPLAYSFGEPPNVLFKVQRSDNHIHTHACIFMDSPHVEDGYNQHPKYIHWRAPLAHPGYEAPLRELAVSPDRTTLACCYGDHLVFVQTQASSYSCVRDVPGEARSIAWMQQAGHIAAGDGAKVRLWDLRLHAPGMALRFKNDKRITGLKALNEHQLLVADNHSLKVFDTRWPSAKANQCVMRFNVRQELAQAKMAVNSLGIIAVYGEQSVDLLSLRTGRHVQSHPLNGTQRGSVISDLAWWDDALGVPYAQVCTGNRIHRIKMDMKGQTE